ncbi:DUF4126 domain-containing protein [Pseudonocardiaceae bacterium YIM PH 21723]|nr:DUF4126 domain-containing protein [Pseudonocardiaceae bacterium YIM PH 21723]
MIAALTGIGLSAAAGLNAYIPLLLVALLARFTSVIDLPPDYAWLSSWWSIAVVSVLLLAELILDKVPVVDSINDTIATLIRPAVGGLIFAATTAAQKVDESDWMREHSWVGIAAGVLVSAIVHAGKMTARPVVNTASVGVGAPVVSTLEDIGSVGLSLIAVFLPLLVIVAVGLMIWGFVVLFRRIRGIRERLRARSQRA